jgi:hypothetical protein
MHEQGFKVSSTGLVHGMPPEPCVVVILSVAGDLARTTLVPSLYALGCQMLLPEPFALLGVARRGWDNDTFRDAIRTYAQEKKGFSDETGGSLPSASLLCAGISMRHRQRTMPGCVNASRPCRLSTTFPIMYCFISLSRRLAPQE